MRFKDSDLLKSAQETQETWGIILDMLEGMVKQTMDSGWTEEQARDIVMFGLRGNGSKPPDEPGETNGK